MNKFKSYTSLGVFLTVCSFGIAHAIPSATDKSLGNVVPNFIFGGTYNNSSKSRAGLLTCLTPDFINTYFNKFNKKNDSSGIDFKAKSSRDSTEKSVTTEVTVSTFWGLSSETTSYTTVTKTDNYSLTVNYGNDYSSVYTVRTKYPAIETGLNPEAKNLYDSVDIALANRNDALALENYKKFRQMCGTGVISQMDANLTFKFVLVFNFTSVTEKQGASGISSFAEALKVVKNRGVGPDGNTVKFDLNIVAFQLGGDPNALKALLEKYARKPEKKIDNLPSNFLNTFFNKNYDDGSVKQDGSTFSLRCSMGLSGADNPCVNLINELMNYAILVKDQVPKNDYYYANPFETPYPYEIQRKYRGIRMAYANGTAAALSKEKNKLWIQYSKDERSFRYVSRYLNYLQSLVAQDVIGKMVLKTDKEKSDEKSALSKLITQLNSIRNEYSNIISLYSRPNIKDLIKNCYMSVTQNNACQLAADNIFKERTQQFKDEAVTDTLIHYLMNSQYTGDFYVEEASSVRCNVMPISDLQGGFYFADCPKSGAYQPKFTLKMAHGIDERLDIHPFAYEVGDVDFVYSSYKDAAGNLVPEPPNGANEVQGGDILKHPSKNVNLNLYSGTMSRVTIPKISGSNTGDMVTKSRVEVEVDLVRFAEE